MRQIFGNLTLGSAFAQADDILTTAAKGIAEIITHPGYINVDFKDVRTVMKDSGVAIMGSFAAEGETRASKAVEGALSSPLLKDNQIEGARYILLNISSGTEQEVTMDEVSIITDYIQEEAGLAADLIWGNCIDESLGNKLSVTIIATGFQTKDEREKETSNKKVISMLMPENAPLVKPVNEFVKPSVKEDVTSKVVTSAQKQNGLFDILAQADEETNSNIVRHNLMQEEPEEEPEPETEPDGLVFKLTETVMTFEQPLSQPAPQPQAQAPQPQPEPVVSADENKTNESIEEQLRKSRERIMRLKDLSMKLRNGNIQELENVPAYKRKEISLQQTPASNESSISKFSLSENDGTTEIRKNNSFLHDNVD
jgi:cell division protein FtsZ